MELSQLPTCLIRSLLVLNPSAQSFPICYTVQGQYRTDIRRQDLELEYISRPQLQSDPNPIHGLDFLPILDFRTSMSIISGPSIAPGITSFLALVDAPNIIWDVQAVPVFNAAVTLGGNRVLNILNPINGGSYVLKIIQDGIGSRTLTLGGGNWKVINGGGGLITLSTDPGSVDLLAFMFDGVNFYANLGPNYN